MNYPLFGLPKFVSSPANFIICTLLFLTCSIHSSNAQQCPTAQEFCAFEAYGVNNSDGNFVGVDPLTGAQTAIAPISAPNGGFIGGGEVIEGVYYFTSDGSIFSTNLVTGEVCTTAIVSGCASGSMTSLEVDPTTGILYGLEVSCGVSTQLLQIDLTMGTCFTVGVPNTSVTCGISLIIDETGQAYIIDIVGDDITPIDLATGASTGPGLPLGLDLNFGQDYDFDCPSGGMVFGFLYDNGAGVTKYVSIDPLTGTVTELDNLGATQLASFAFCNSADPCANDTEAPTVTGCEGIPTANYVIETYAFDYIDISATGTRVASGDDVSSINSELNMPVSLGTPFALYDMTYAELVPSTNGYISTDVTDGGGDLSNDCPLPDDPSTGGGARLYPLHDDLDINLGSDPTAGVFYQYFASSPVPSPSGATVGVSVFQWRADHFPDAMTIDLDFEALLFDNGEIVYQYAMIGGEMGSGATVGMQSMEDAMPFLATTISCNTAGSVVANTAVALVPFMPSGAGAIPNDLGLCGATVTLENPEFSDNCDFVITNDLTGSEDLIGFLPVGATNVTFTATDGNGNTAVCSEQIVVADTEGPVLDCPEAIIVNLEAGECSEIISFAASATDNCNSIDEITIVQTEGTLSGEIFEPGITTITFVATDLNGNSSECSFDVNLVSYSGPVLTALACNDDVNISVDDACSIEFNADMFLEGGPYACYDNYIVSIRPFGNETQEYVPVGPQDFSSALGTHEFVVTAPDGNSCWGEFTVEDKLGPAITVGDVTVSCIDPSVDLPVDADDNCGNVTVVCSDVTVPGTCETGIDRIITRTCVATDQNGRTSTATGTITITTIGTGDITAPITPVLLPCGTGTSPEEITEYFNDKIDTDGDGFPDTEINPTNPSGPNCPSAENFERNEGIVFGYFNYPAVGCDGNVYPQQVDNNVCKLYTSYSDQEIPACAPGCNGNVKVIRTWTVLDWCTPDATPFTFVQIIKAVDTEAPTMELADDFGVSVNPWNCLGDFSLPAPKLLHDLCTADISYSVSGPAGTTLLAPNTVSNPSDNWIVFGAPKGLAVFTYVAADCCGNTTSEELTVNVYDTTPPTPVAKENIILNLTTNGQPDENGNAQGFAKLYNTSVNNGSYDGCSNVRIEIRREESPVACGYTGNSTYATNDDFPDAGDTNPTRADYDPDNGEYVKFCCADITDVDPVTGVEFGLVPVRMRVFDDGNMNGIFGDWIDTDNDGVKDAGEYDNYNETWVTVRVEGKTIASIVCPPDVTLACDMDYTDPAMIGTATSLALCGSESVEVTFNPQLDACGVGFVIATYTVVGSTNPVISCNQRIDVENPYPAFDPTEINFPRDLPTNATAQISCTDDITYAAPTWTAGACDFIGYTEDVDTFFFEVDPVTGVTNNACFKILRRFTVIDWCVYDATNGQDGLYYGSQTIKITDRDAPVLNNCDPVMFAVDDNNDANNNGNICERLSVVLTNNATDAGNCASDWLKWQVFVDTWGDNVIDYEYSSFLPTNDSNINNDTNGNGINDRYLAPTSSGEDVSITVVEAIESSMFNHVVTWKVTDGCGNVASCTTTFMVVDKKAPTPYCISVHTALMADPDGDGPLMPMVELWAKDFDKGAYDNCTEQEDLIFTFGDSFPVLTLLDQAHYFKGEGQLATEAEYLAGTAQYWDPVAQTAGMVFDCNDRPSVNIIITVTDEKGNSDSCLVFLGIIDNNDDCENAGSRADIEGLISTASGEFVPGTQVNLDALLPEYPRSTEVVDGAFAFTNNDLFVDYEITASLNDNPANGVSTLDLVLIQRHIVGFAELDSPYKAIAADISNDEKISAIDVIELRKVILGVQDEFNNVDSWRFVDAAQDFADIVSPWPIDYSVDVDELESNISSANMVAVKMGDVNGTYSALNNTQSTDVRSTNAVTLSIVEETLNIGDQERINITNDSQIATQGIQMTIEFNGALPRAIESSLAGFGDSNYSINGNLISLSWNSNALQTIEAGDVLFTIVTDVESTISTSDVVTISDRKLRSEVYVGESLEINNIELVVRDDTGSQIEVATQTLLQNEPNPFTHETTISYYLSNTESTAVISIMDVMGKVIYSQNVNADKGWNTHTISQSDLSASGVYYYQLNAGNYSEKKSMILVK